MLRFLTRVGVRRGLLGGSRPWLAVLAAASAARLLGRVTGRQPKVLYSAKLERGRTLVITHGGPAMIPSGDDAKLEA